MVPLAVVAVLLLLGAVVFVGYLETREEPEPSVDASLAVDATEANVQTALRDATWRAAETAAQQPLTEPNEDDEFGALLKTLGGPDGVDGHDQREQDANDAFYNYLRALIYFEVEENLAHAGERRGDIETEVSVQSVEDPATFAAAIERVSIEPKATNVTVEIEGVRIVVRQDETVIDERETDVEVTVPTPIAQLQERTQEYQYAIDDAAVTERGFEQRFNARMYAIAWARGWAQNYQAPVSAVLANRHIEPSANAALYRTQQDIFGDADPNLRDATRLGWICMALQDGEDLFDTYTASQDGLAYETVAYRENPGGDELALNDSLRYELPEATTEELCRSAQYTMDHLIEGPPRAPGLAEMLGQQEQVTETETLDVGELASVAFGELVQPGYQHSFERAADRVFSVKGYAAGEATVGGPSLTTQCERGTGSPRRAVTDVGVDATQHEQPGDRYYRYDTAVEVTVEERRTCRDAEGNVTDRPTERDSYSFEFTTEVGEEEASPLSKLNRDGISPGASIQRTYEPGGPPTPGFNNFAGAEDEITGALIGSASTSSYERWIERQLDDDTLAHGGSVRFDTTEVVELDHRELIEGPSLVGELADDVLALRAEAAAIEAEFERHEIVTANPVDDLVTELEALRAEHVETDAYESVGEKALYEARYAYYLTLREHLEALAETQDAAAGRVTDGFEDVDGLTADVGGYLRAGVHDSGAEPTAFERSDSDVSYEVSATPTYLVTEEVEADRVPAVGEGQFAPLATRNQNVVDLPYEAAMDGVLDWIVDRLPWASGGSNAEIPFRMAGDVLKGAELALEASDEQHGGVDDQEFVNDTLDERIEQFEANVAAAIEQYEGNLSRAVAASVHPEPGAECVLYDGPDHDRYPGWNECAGVDSALESEVEQLEVAVRQTVEETLEPYGTAETALLIGDGRATAYVAENVTGALDQETYAHSEFAEFEADQWEGIVNASVWPAAAAASTATVEIGTAADAAAIDNATGKALTAASEAAIQDRFDHLEALGETAVEDSIDARWLGNERRTQARAARMPAGMPLLPIPSKWVATANAWHVSVRAEYARFELSANLGRTEEATSLTYVRENASVSHEIGGEERTLGWVEPIGFETDTAVVVVTTPGVGVGDRGSVNPECSTTFPDVGELPDDAENDEAGGAEPGCEPFEPLRGGS